MQLIAINHCLELILHFDPACLLLYSDERKKCSTHTLSLTHTHTHTHTHTLSHSLTHSLTLTHTHSLALSHTHTHTHTHTHSLTHSHTHTHTHTHTHSCFLCGGSRRIHSLWRLHDARRHSMCPETRTDPAGAFGASGVLDPSGLPGALCVWWPACGPVRWTRSAQIPNGTPADHPPAHPVQQPHPWFTRARAQLPVRPHVSGLQSNNSLTHISESTFGNLRKLAYLDLSFNSFCKIEEQTFSALESLVMLRLTDNPRLSDFHPQAFSHASALQVLDISRNNLSRLNVSSLSALGGLRSLGLSGNPWRCACDAEELCLWVHTDTFKFQGRLYLGSRGCCFCLFRHMR